jgi:ketosteroid isomerase-like protein
MPVLTPLEVVTSFNRAWAVGDVDTAMRHVAEDGVYALYISGELLPHGGETAGRDNIAVALHQVRVDFDYLLYRPLQLKAKDDVVRFQVEFMYRHRLSGEILSGRLRFVMRVRDGVIVRADEYHDRAKVEAFMRLFGKSA